MTSDTATCTRCKSTFVLTAGKARRGCRYCNDCLNAFNRDYRARRRAVGNIFRDKSPDPIKERARRTLASEVRAGRIKRMPCEVCGEPNAHAHHPDYARPYEVRWLCPFHHTEVHRNENASLNVWP